MSHQPSTKRSAFTLIEMLVVITIIGILAAIIIPAAGGAKKSAQKRRAAVEMNAIKVAALQFYADHKYMPWPGDPKVGKDEWATDETTQIPVMDLLTGSNALRKIYLQIPEKSRKKDPQDDNPPMRFLDPWGQEYQIGMDRNMDGAVEVSAVGVSDWNGKTIMEKVLVISKGPTDTHQPLKTFDVGN